MGEMRLNKYLAEHGICSRREADKLIEAGRVTVNGKTATMGEKVGENDFVKVGKKSLHNPNRKVVLAFYKPQGVTCTEKDAHANRKITDVFKYPIRVTYAGRLDKESEGLLLMTNDGDLIDAIMRSANGHEKEYLVKTDKEITEDFIDKMAGGIYLKELQVKTKACKVAKEGKYTFRIVLTQGLNRQIRRMCKELGYQVKNLKRVRIMNIQLGNLKEGQFRELDKAEQSELYQRAGIKRVN